MIWSLPFRVGEHDVRVRSMRLYRDQCLRTHEEQAAYLEQLRHKWRYHDDDFRCMQALGDVIAGPNRPTAFGPQGFRF